MDRSREGAWSRNPCGGRKIARASKNRPGWRTETLPPDCVPARQRASAPLGYALQLKVLVAFFKGPLGAMGALRSNGAKLRLNQGMISSDFKQMAIWVIKKH
jgi:hypothetical protein